MVSLVNQLPGSMVIFSGGEPAFHPDILNIYDRIDQSVTVGIVSNGSRTKDFWQQLAHSRVNSRVMISCHYASIDPDEFFDKVCFLHGLWPQHFGITFLVPTDLQQWADSKKLFAKLIDRGISTEAKLQFHSAPIDGRLSWFKTTKNSLVQNNENFTVINPNYTKEQIDWASDQNQHGLLGAIVCRDRNLKSQSQRVTGWQLIYSDQNNYQGWRCMVDRENFVVYPNGDVYTSLCPQRKHLGNIYDSVNLDAGAGQICHTPRCSGWLDMYATKVRQI